ncbi:hypothetical protein FUAX_45670 (plasmid) [Fulvitalea axinellae]|uniref:MFS transporter n=1 Tax=Fulvitalea axinellae TaxID=1182444 RepID=A0AAU9DHU5_9BACT|nr:hypothetical protein FUAX_45670 [Fulvitalea axinellae]
MSKDKKLADWLRNAPEWVFALFAFSAAFCTYTCMYAFRKPFAVATFEGEMFWGVSYKILLVSGQVIGYMASKFIGIGVVSGIRPEKRAGRILTLVGISGIGLFLFAVVPAPYNILFLFVNGLPLGMVFGLVFSFLEGRKNTEVLAIGLSVTQIFSSGMVKSIGKYLLVEYGVSEYWMPVITGLVFFGPLLLFVWMLRQLPPPSEEDIKLRTERKPMNALQRRTLLRKHFTGLTLLVIAYIGFTTFRDFRDNFSAEIWTSLGRGSDAMVFTETEIPIVLVVLAVVGLMAGIRNNMKAFMLNHALVIVGGLLTGLSAVFFQNRLISAEVWFTLSGLGLYLAYVPFNIMMFERMIAAFKSVGNVGFLMYIADSFGYLGSVGVLFYKNFSQASLSWLSFYINASYALAGMSVILVSLAAMYFIRKRRRYNGVGNELELIPAGS